MDRFPTAGHLASWAGLTPGHHQSAKVVKSAKTRPGDRYLKAVLGTAALNIARNKGNNNYLSALYRRLAPRRGPSKAIVAVEHSILTSVWHMITRGESYQDLGGDHFARLNSQQIARRAVRQLEQLGYSVALTLPEATA
jgi:transposase